LRDTASRRDPSPPRTAERKSNHALEAAIIETPIAHLSGPAAVVDPDGLHLAEPVMVHNDTEFRLRLYVKPSKGRTRSRATTVSAETWGALPDATKARIDHWEVEPGG
jgi:hypothetical protein